MEISNLVDHYIRVAIVEDDADIRESVADYIDGLEGYYCAHRYGNAEDALHFLPHAQADIILLDINLPRMSGLELLAQVRSLCPDSEFMVFTVFEDDNTVFDALHLGAAGYITKKTKLPKIKEAIDDLLQGGSPMSPSIARKLLDRFKLQPRPEEKSEDLSMLGRRQLQLLELLSQGLLYKEIADAMGITEGSVKQFINRIYKKLSVQNRFQAVSKYLNKK